MDKMNQYIEVLKNGKGFDWIATHGHSLNKYELIDIIKELEYAIYDRLYDFDAKDVYDAAAEELENLYSCDEEE
jgi:hypothetical protein